MVLEDGVGVDALEQATVDVGVLLNDARVWERDDHAAEAVLEGVAERERHRRARLAAAGRDGESEHAGRERRGVDAGPVDLGAGRVDVALTLGHEPLLVGLEGVPQGLEVAVAFAESRAFGVAPRLGVEAVGVDQGRVEHPHPQLHR